MLRRRTRCQVRRRHRAALAARSKEITAERRTESARIARCRREIADIEAELLAGNPDVSGLCLALSESGELRILQNEQRRRN